MAQRRTSNVTNSLSRAWVQKNMKKKKHKPVEKGDSRFRQI